MPVWPYAVILRGDLGGQFPDAMTELHPLDSHLPEFFADLNLESATLSTVTPHLRSDSRMAIRSDEHRLTLSAVWP